MAILKYDSYGHWQIDLGDDVDADMKEQLKVSHQELGSAINQENVADKLFSRILKNRSKAHAALLDKVPGA